MSCHYAHDVQNDGNCFYSCIVKTCGDVIGVGNDQSSISKVRQMVAHKLLNDQSIKDTVKDLLSILRQCPELKSEYPFVTDRDRSKVGYESFAAAIVRNGTWASEIEHSIVKDLLLTFEIDLITLDCHDHTSLLEKCDIETQLLSALHSATKDRCIVFVHISNNHYMYMTLDYETIPKRTAFQDYIDDFLNTDESDIKETKI